MTRSTVTEKGAKRGRASSASPPAAERLSREGLASMLRNIECRCVEKGARMTPQRREIVELMLKRGGRAKAYDLQQEMQSRHGRVAPTTIYRVLDFLIEHDIVHRVDSLNRYQLCTGEHPHRSALFLICTQCEASVEVHEHEAGAHVLGIVASVDPSFEASSVEVKGRCSLCREARPRAAQSSDGAPSSPGTT